MARLLQPRRSQLPGGGGRPCPLGPSQAAMLACMHPTPQGPPSLSPLLTAPQSRPRGFRHVHRSDPKGLSSRERQGQVLTLDSQGASLLCALCLPPRGLACGAEGRLLWRWGTQPRAWIPGQDGQRAWDPRGACHRGRGGGGTSRMVGNPGGGAPGGPWGWGVQGGGVSWDGGCPGVGRIQGAEYPGGGASWG